MNGLLFGISTSLLLSLCSIFGCAAGAAAEDFYQGKTVNFIIGY